MIAETITAFVITAISFVGQQGGKAIQHERDVQDKLIQMRWDACEKLHECQPLNDYLDPIIERGKPDGKPDPIP